MQKKAERRITSELRKLSSVSSSCFRNFTIFTSIDHNVFTDEIVLCSRFMVF